jgi:hypothetical protein
MVSRLCGSLFGRLAGWLSVWVSALLSTWPAGSMATCVVACCVLLLGYRTINLMFLKINLFTGISHGIINIRKESHGTGNNRV